VTGSDNLKKPGKLTVMFTVDENGSLLRIRPFKKSSNPELDDAILSACRVLQWKPATYHGRRIFCEGVHEFFYDKGVIAGYKFRFKDR
jgi:TonB family protein